MIEIRNDTLTFSDAKEWLNGLVTDPDGDYPTPPSGQGTYTAILPGPASEADLQNENPGPIIFLALGAGPGFTDEHAFDKIFIETLVIGDQGDPETGYASAEAIALWLDRKLTAFDSSGSTMNGVLLTGIDRVGGRPQLRGRDVAARYSFQCSYIAEVDSGI